VSSLTNTRGKRKERVGVVVSDKMDKTAVVAVDSFVVHPLYGKRMKRTRKFMAHDPENSCRVGDTVRLMETRPLSRHKRWRIQEIVHRAE